MSFELQELLVWELKNHKQPIVGSFALFTSIVVADESWLLTVNAVVL